YTPSADTVLTAGRLAALAFLHFNTEGSCRYAAKGMPLAALEGRGQPDDNLLEASVRDFERRKQRFLTITGDAGFWYDRGSVFPMRPDFAGLWGATHAKSGYTLSVVSVQPSATISGPYLPLTLTEPRHLTRVAFDGHASLLAPDPWQRGTCLA